MERWIDLGCGDGWNTFKFCFKNRSNQFYLVDLKDPYPYGCDSSQGIYMKVKKIVIVRMHLRLSSDFEDHLENNHQQQSENIHCN